MANGKNYTLTVDANGTKTYLSKIDTDMETLRVSFNQDPSDIILGNFEEVDEFRKMLFQKDGIDADISEVWEVDRT